VELVRFSTKLLIIGLDRDQKFEDVNFCKERALEAIVERMAAEYGVKPKELSLVSPACPTKEVNLQRPPFGE
jgi:hypothetical protein